MQNPYIEPPNSAAVIPFPPGDAETPATPKGGYEAVRFNAVKHGILSKLVVLAHEDHAEFADLLAALIPESRDWWDEHVSEDSYPATAEGLAEFIRETLEPVCIRMAQEARFAPAIKAQTLGEGLQAHRFIPLNRYETHLDRKFERTLAMLLKLKELRSA